MIRVVYIRHTLDDNIRQPDYTDVKDINEFIEWFFKLGDKITFYLTDRNRMLTIDGWVKSQTPSPELMQAYDSKQRILITVQQINSDEGILYESVKHCSSSIIRQMALKCVKTN